MTHERAAFAPSGDRNPNVGRASVQRPLPDAVEASRDGSALDADLCAAETTREPVVSTLAKRPQVPLVAAEDAALWFG
jgi:hypothetical protein